VLGTLASDIRLKRDIVPVGQLANGLRLYRYRYVWSPTLYVGVMAQEVRDVVPTAVVRGRDGYLRVDYRQLGLRLRTWDEWVAANPADFKRWKKEHSPAPFLQETSYHPSATSTASFVRH
jgi:hypothetical protein